MVFAYIRVSSKQQNTDRQLEAINEYANEKGLTINRIIEETQSGKDFNRNMYKSLKDTLRSGDLLIIKELDRLGRNMHQIKHEWQSLETLGVSIIIIDTPILNTVDKSDLERTLISNIVFELLSYMAEKERIRLMTRQAEGIAIAKTKGKYAGRKRIQCDNFDTVYKSWKAGEITATKAMEQLNLKRDTFYRRVREFEASNGLTAPDKTEVTTKVPNYRPIIKHVSFPKTPSRGGFPSQ